MYQILSRVLTPRHVRGRLAVLLLPFAVFGIWLKVLRIKVFFPEIGLDGMAIQLSSDVAFGLAWALLWVVLSANGPQWLRGGAFYIAHVATLVLAVFAAFNHEYVIRTGAPLGWEQIVYAWYGQGELEVLLNSQIIDSTVALVTWSVASATFLPTLLGPVVSRVLNMRVSRLARRAAVGIMVGLVLASGWSAPTASAAFSLAPPVRMLVEPVREAGAYPARPERSVSIDPHTRLTVRGEGGEERRNLVVIVLESQRASSTLPPTRAPVTPVLDELAGRSIAPERGYTVLPHTSKALTAVHCGIAPPADMANSEADPGGIPARCLPHLLAEHGYATGFFQSATEMFERRRYTVHNLGFDYFLPVDHMNPQGFARANYFGFEDNIMLGPQREWLERHADSPFMLSMLTVTGHHDYNLEGYVPIDFVDDPLLNKYLNGIHYQDQFVGRVLEMFKAMGLYDDTVFVVVGDHGEGFGEHRLYQHDNTIYEEGVRIPLMIHDPKAEALSVPGPASQLAILPTVVDALGFDLLTTGDYAPSLISGQPQGPVLVTCHIRARCSATLEGNRKVIHHFGDRRDEVFDLAQDNFEHHDIVTQVDRSWLTQQRNTALSWYVAWEDAYVAARN